MATAEILTPDQRVRVFVSSAIEELAEERRTVRAAIEQLCLTPVLFELGARPYPPRSLYLAYLRQSHVFVGIYGDRYGWVGPGMDVSGLEDELRHAGNLPLLLYVKTPAPDRDPRLKGMLDEVTRAGGVSYKKYRDAAELGSLLAADLALLLTERFTSPTTAATVSLPKPASEFVGRSVELSELVELVTGDGVRLVTLTGPGGIGKTRLAIEAARATADHFADGVAFVPLAARGPEDLLDGVATALGLKDLGQEPLADLLAGYLQAREQLVVLDNFEHLLSAAPQLAHLLERTLALRLMVTSRSALRLSGEEEFPVPPLGLPRVTNRVVDVERAESTQLFCRRVAAVRRGYRLTEADAATVARICRRLDGLPLALELVAARANVLSIAELADRLDQVLDLSARSPDVPERQRTLRQTMDWSYAQLPPAARALLPLVGVFAGPFSVTAAAAVCELDEGELIDGLAVLVDHSLLRAQWDGGAARFSLLEIVREYALSRLDPATEERARARHAAYFRDVAVAASPGLRGAGQRETVIRLDTEADEVGAALDWLVDHGRGSDVADMCWALWLYHWCRGSMSQGMRWAAAVLASGEELAPAQRARLLATHGMLATWRREYDTAEPELSEAMSIAVRENDDEVRTLVSVMLMILAGGQGDEERARALADDAIRLAGATDARWIEALAMTGRCWLNAAVGRFAGEEPLFEASVTRAREGQDPLTIAMAVGNLAELRMWQGRWPEAAASLVESLRIMADLRTLFVLAGSLHSAAYLLAHEDEWAVAVSLEAAADALFELIDTSSWPPWLPRRQWLLATAREHLAVDQFERAWQTGFGWSLEEATDAACVALEATGGSVTHI